VTKTFPVAEHYSELMTLKAGCHLADPMFCGALISLIRAGDVHK
jgi:hypothetical protein